MSQSKKTLLWIARGAILLPMAAQAKTILPDSCGSDDVRFDVDLKKDQPPPPGPEEGKAQIVFIQNTGAYYHLMPPIRFAIDGAWVGANKNNSYFAVSVTPGEHHICTSLQLGGPRGSIVKSSVQMATFTAEAGKTYYYEAAITFNGGVGGSNQASVGFDLTELKEDVGKYRVKAWKLAISKPNK